MVTKKFKEENGETVKLSASEVIINLGGGAETLDSLLNNSKVLWTNNNPESAFTTQTVTVLNDSDYNYICLIYDGIQPYENYDTYFFKKPAKTYNLPFTQSLWGSGTVQLRQRYIKRVSNTQYEFSGGDLNGTANNNVCVPIQIIGIKKVL